VPTGPSRGCAAGAGLGDDGTVRSPTPSPFVLVGPSGVVGQRLAERLVVGSEPPRVITGHSSEAELRAAVADAATLFVLGPTDGPDITGTGGSAYDIGSVRRVLHAGADAGVGQVVALSSAMVYGAWPNNPVPLTEDAPLRPDSGADHAVSRAELERVLVEWAAENPSAKVAVLRPVVTVSGDQADWLRRSAWARTGLRVDDADPPRQFLHLDDLVSALVLAHEHELTGAYNVAPDGWLAADSFHDLEGAAPRVGLGPGVAARLAQLWFRAGLTDAPPEVLPYTMQPWVVANDRLRRAGWEPRHTNEEAFVEADRAGPLRSLSPRVRQELSLVAAGAVVLGVATGAVLGIRRRRRR
jgi:nucleoside-diphosphate-sugar epimerase